MNWENLYRIVDLAREVETADREAFIAEQCGADLELLAMVRDILEVNVEAGFLQPPDLQGTAHGGQELGDFLLIEEIARGGMGIVYRGVQKEINRPVAIKVLPLIQRSNTVVFERFQRESNAASSIEHAHAVPILAAGDTQGTAWYAMPLIDGHDLAEELRRQRDQDMDALLPAFSDAEYVPKVVQQIAGVADALQLLHNQSIFHRDIKPRNLLLNREGHMAIVDFGLAKVNELETLTATDAVQGTPYYMSPEQARTLQHPIDHRTDVYSLCVVLFEMLTLKRPFDGDSAEIVLGKIASGTHLDLRKANPNIPRDLVTICEKGMARDPKHRYATAADLAKDLNAFLALKAIAARPKPLSRKLSEHFMRKRFAYLGVAASLLTAGAIMGGQDVLAQRRAEETQLQTLRSISDGAPDLQRYARAQNTIDAVLQDRAQGSELYGEALKAQALVDRFLNQRIETIESLNSAGSGGHKLIGPRRYPAPPDPNAYFEALILAQKTLAEFPMDSRLQRLASVESVLPRMQIQLDESSSQYQGQAVAWMSEKDPYTSTFSTAVELGPLPLADLPMPAGEVRITVVVPGVGFSEHDRIVKMGSTPSIQAIIRPTEESPANMVLIQLEDQTYHVIEVEDRSPCCLLSDTVHVPDFYIDEAVVSNGEYLEYLEASGRKAPVIWLLVSGEGKRLAELDLSIMRQNHPLEHWKKLPALGVTLQEAQAYAEYYGRRLAGHHEHEYALRGRENITVPTPKNGESFLINTASEPIDIPVANISDYHRANSNLKEVRHPDYKHPPHGLYHALGNVLQMTWGASVSDINHTLFLEPLSRWNLGVPWFRVVTSTLNLSSHGKSSLSPGTVALHEGFRCAKSVKPIIQ